MFKTVDTQSIHLSALLGIKPAILRDLGHLVILSGPNGGGKSRFLSMLEDFRVASTLVDSTARLALEQASSARQRLEAQLAENPRRIDILRNLQIVAAQQKAYEYRLANGMCVNDGIDSNFSVIVMHPLTGSVHGDPEQVTLGGFDQWENPIDFQPVEGMSRVTTHLMGVAYSLYQAEHPAHRDDPLVAAKVKRANAFVDMVRKLVGLEISYSADSGFPLPVVNGRRYVPGELSSGQSILLAWAVVIETRVWFESRLRNKQPARLVVALDEPENHLHPTAVVSILRRVIDYIGSDGQVWLATHSPTVLAAFAPEASVYRVADGQIEYASSNLAKVIEGLVGGEAERHMMRDILDDADRVAFYKFAVECLQNALVVGDAGADDPQSRQIATVVRARIEEKGKLRMLDYASGKARFAMALSEILTEDERKKIDYLTYDDPDFDVSRADKLRNLSRLYPTGSSAESSARASNNLSDFQYENRVDVVVLCNVLHEVESAEWFHLFQKIHSVLLSTGFLLILEDLEMPVGEMPNRHGYLVLDLEDLRSLFGSSSDVRPLNPGVNPRCSAVAVAYGVLSGFADEDGFRATFDARLQNTLRGVRTRAIKELKRLRDSRDKNYATGRRHARTAMLLANVEIALDK